MKTHLRRKPFDPRTKCGQDVARVVVVSQHPTCTTCQRLDHQDKLAEHLARNSRDDGRPDSSD